MSYIDDLTLELQDYFYPAEMLKKSIEPCPNTIENIMDLMVLMGIVLVLMETIMVSTGMWWILLVGCYIILEKCTKHTTKIDFVMVLLEKANGAWWYLNGNIGFYVMVSIGLLLLLFFNRVSEWKISLN